MSKTKQAISVFCILTILWLGTIAVSATPSDDSTKTASDAGSDSILQQKLEKLYPELSIFKCIDIAGYLDFTYEYNFNESASGNNSFRVFDTEANSFAVRMVQLMLDRQTQNPDDVGFRIRLDFGKDAKVITPYGFDASNFDLEEAFLTYKAPIGKGMDITLGKFATLHGAEVIEAKDDFNISRGLLFGYAIPFTHTGILFGYPFTDTVSAKLGAVNGWDNVSDNNNSKSVHGMISLAPNPKLSFTVGGTYGPEQYHNNHDHRGLVDAVGTYKPTDKLTLIANYDYGSEEHIAPDGGNATWQGTAGYINYALTQNFSITGRVEWFSDQDGIRTGIGQDLAEGTITGEYKINDHLKVRLEYRHDHSNQAVFEDNEGGFKKDQDTIAFQTLVIF